MLNDAAIARLRDAVRRHLDRVLPTHYLIVYWRTPSWPRKLPAGEFDFDVLMAESQQGVEIAAVERLGEPLDVLHVG